MANKPKGKRISDKNVAQADETPYIPVIPAKAEDEYGGWGRDGLTVRQRKFVKAYVGTAAGNATMAAEMAGYRAENRDSLKVTASRLLTYANVQRALSRAMAKRLGGKKWTLTGLVEIANTSMADFMTVDGQGRQRVDFEKAQAAGAIGAIKKLRLDPEGNPVGLELYDRMAALQALAKIHGSLVERVEHSGPGGGPIDLRNLTDEELEQLERIATNASRRAGLPDDPDPLRN